jgi:hypothetical protein
LGENIGTNVGIAISLTNVPAADTNGSFYGAYFVTQLVEAHQKMNVTTGSTVYGYQRDRNGLDNQVRYGYGSDGYTVAFPAELANNPSWTDSPDIEFGGVARWVSENETFKDYLMFQPFSSGSIPVPMYLATWSWEGSAKTNGASGGILLSQKPPSPTVAPTYDFPVWTMTDTNSSPWDVTNLPSFNEN